MSHVVPVDVDVCAIRFATWPENCDTIFVFIFFSPSLSFSLSSRAIDVQRKWKYCVPSIYLICCCCFCVKWSYCQVRNYHAFVGIEHTPFTRSPYFVCCALYVSAKCRWKLGRTLVLSIRWNKNSFNLLPFAEINSCSHLVVFLVLIFYHSVFFIILVLSPRSFVTGLQPRKIYIYIFFLLLLEHRAPHPLTLIIYLRIFLRMNEIF